MASSTSILLATVSTLLLLAYLATAVTPDSGHASQTTARPVTGNDHQTGFTLAGIGWAAIDTRVSAHTDLRFRLTHDTIDDLCMTSRQGAGIYDEGHHTIVHLWALGKDPFADGRFLAWLGTPHLALPIVQTGVCGESSAIHLEPGDTARLVVASTLPGYRIELLGDDAHASMTGRHVALEDHPDHVRHAPLPTAVLSEDSIAPVVAVDREWRSRFETGPAAFYGIPWLHTETDSALPIGGFQVLGQIDWGFDGATEYVADPAPATKRGAFGTTTDWAALFAARTEGGRVEGYLSEHVQGGAYATSYEAGASFLSVPLGPGA